MNPSSSSPPSAAPSAAPSATSSAPSVDEDLAEQAHPGHGVPSQDPTSAAQFPLSHKETEREAKSVVMGGGVVAGAATGAAIGAAVGGPVGVVVGGTLGTVVGALGAAAAGKMTSPEASKIADPIPTPGHTKPSPAD